MPMSSVSVCLGPAITPGRRARGGGGDRALNLRDARRRGRRSASGLRRTRTAYFCPPNTCTWATPVDLRDLLRQQRVGVFVHRRKRQACPNTSVMNRTGASAGFTLRKLGGVGISAGKKRCAALSADLHVERGGVDVAAEIELHGDRGRAGRARRGHRGDAGDGRELPLDRRRHRGGHGFGAGARQRAR